MPVFFYQSFNASSTPDHNLKSLTAQSHTRKAHETWADLQREKKRTLLYPVLDDDRLTGNRHAEPVAGPPRLVATVEKDPTDNKAQENMWKGVGTGEFLQMMQQKILQNQQAVNREMQAMPDVTAFGELDGAHSDFSDMSRFAGNRVGASSNDMACHNFTVYANNQRNVELAGNGDGWYAIRYLGFVVVFVHVPNDIAGGMSQKAAAEAKAQLLANAKSKPTVASGGVQKSYASKKMPKAKKIAGSGTEDLVDFYQKMQSEIIREGKGQIDVIMGDTNQSRLGFTAEVVSDALGKTFKNAHSAKNFSPIDTYDTVAKGTNSVGKKMFDVVVYNADTVTVDKLCYITQQAPFRGDGQVAAVTDHMGVAVSINKIRAQ